MRHTAILSRSYNLLQRPAWQLGLLVLIGFGLYLQTLEAPFLFDDYVCIEDHPAIRNFSYFTDFSRIHALNIEPDLKNSFELRPLGYLTFALNYAVGGTAVWGYHLVNTIIHVLNACLVYLLAAISLRPLRAAPGGAAPWVAWLPLLSALLFVTHPLHTQAVTYVVQRFTSLVALLYLGTLLLYILARTTRRAPHRYGSYGLALLTALLAMKTKETAFTLPVSLALYEFVFLTGPLRKRLLGLLPFFLTMAVIPLTLFGLTAPVASGGKALIDQSLNLVNFQEVGRWEYLRTEFSVLVTYLRLLLVPTGQNFDPDYPLAQRFLEPRTAGSFLLLLLLAGIALACWWRGRRTDDTPGYYLRLVAFGLCWFFVTIAVESSIIPIDDPFMEYRAYLPSVGIFLAMLAGLGWGLEHRPALWRPALVMTLAFCCVLGLATLARNRLYLDPLGMYLDVARKSPDKPRVHVALGIHYLMEERYQAALHAFDRALQLRPQDVKPVIFSGYALAATGRFDQALVNFDWVLRIDPDNFFAHSYRGATLLALNRTDAAEPSLRRALEINPHFPFARYWLGRLYEQSQRPSAAIREYEALLRDFPDDARADARLRALKAGPTAAPTVGGWGRGRASSGTADSRATSGAWPRPLTPAPEK